jgi:hypothetical protein
MLAILLGMIVRSIMIRQAQRQGLPAVQVQLPVRVESTVVDHNQTVIKVEDKEAYFLFDGELLVEPGMPFKVSTDSKGKIVGVVNDQNIGEILHVDVNEIRLPYVSVMSRK